METEQIWLIIGFIGQTIFASRFLVQWVVSERAAKSIIPNINLNPNTSEIIIPSNDEEGALSVANLITGLYIRKC